MKLGDLYFQLGRCLAAGARLETEVVIAYCNTWEDSDGTFVIDDPHTETLSGENVRMLRSTNEIVIMTDLAKERDAH